MDRAVRRQARFEHSDGPGWEPSYLQLHRSGELNRRAAIAMASLEACRLCPHECGVDRLRGQHGVCRMGVQPVVASWNAHHWEEPPISGSSGSGTIFLSGCTGRCSFCQNYPISQFGYGNTVTTAELSEMMLELQDRGCHNINFVTPTHFVPQILQAVDQAAEQGLRIPLVYNTSGYETLPTLQLLEGVIDVWLPDAKYGSDAEAKRLSGFAHYVEHNRAALREMFRQVGAKLIVDEDGLARRGMIIRHLVLPGDLARTRTVLQWIATELDPAVHVSLMDQYFPAFRVITDVELGRKISEAEYDAALEAFEAAGLENGWLQEHDDGCGQDTGL